MFQRILIFLIIFFAAVIETAVFPNFFPRGTVPSLLLVLVVFWTIREGFERALSKTVMIGLFMDLIYSYPVGINIISVLLISFGVNYVAKRLLLAHKTGQLFLMAVVVLFGVAGAELVTMVVAKIAAYLPILEKWTARKDLPLLDIKIVARAAYSSLIFLIILSPLDKLESFLESYNRRMQGDKSFRSR